MLYACVQRFDVTRNLKTFVKFLGTKTRTNSCTEDTSSWLPVQFLHARPTAIIVQHEKGASEHATEGHRGPILFSFRLQLGTRYSRGYSTVLEYEYKVKTVVLGTLKRYFILSLTLYLE
jgi:hypothetical protein